ncbi:MerR family transcriptional regulator [Corynebacterium mayonis]|uniref:MerR family transcriptional regulator n=1 Tax=Corynebacterium mayonis TaxID=3062461 RepID=UPI0031403B3E
MKISDAARAAGCSVRAIRHYHESGALPEPPRTPGGYRDYGVADLAALLRVRAMVDAGIPLADISQSKPSLIDDALRSINQRIAQLEAQRDRLRALSSGDLGAPADIRREMKGLLGDNAYTQAEIDAFDLMALAGVATDKTWDCLRRNLADPCRRAEAVHVKEIWQKLADTPPAQAEALIDDLAAREGLMHGIRDTLSTGEVPLSLVDVPTSKAQTLALRKLSGGQ